MIKKFSFILFWLSAMCMDVVGQDNIFPQDYFQSPIKHKLKLAGSFGELRTNHFHMGVDIKSSKGTSGDPIYAIADGFISRIKIQSGGYGQTIYIDHPNGYTSVYAHLYKFEDSIANFIFEKQKTDQQFQMDFHPSPDEFPVEKGQLIGKMGMTGRAYGPHLHFEIRETASEKPTNPVLWGIKPIDTKAPKINKVAIYHLNDQHEILTKDLFYPKSTTKNNYKMQSDTLSIGAWRIGVGVNAFDVMDGISNKNGVFGIKVLVDDQNVYEHKMDGISFDETRFINAHIDFAYFVKNKSRIQKCFTLPANNIGIYKEINNPIIKLFEKKKQKITIQVFDAENNISELIFWVKRSQKMKEQTSKSFNYYLPFGEVNIIDRKDLKVIMPEGALYENCYLNLNRLTEKSSSLMSPIFEIGDETIPIQKPIDVFIKTTSIPDHLKDKLCLVSCKENKYKTWGGTFESSFFKAKVSEMGSFALMIDTIPPQITAVNFKQDLSNTSRIKFKISDNLPEAGDAEELRFEGTIDGNWVLFEYDKKNKIIFHHLETPKIKGKHALKLVVWDDRNNKSIYAKDFVY